MEKTVLKDTRLTDSEVSLSYFEANIVVNAAAGALQEITEDISIVPLTEHRYITPKAISGKMNNLKIIAKMHFKFFIPSKILLLAK